MSEQWSKLEREGPPGSMADGSEPVGTLAEDADTAAEGVLTAPAPSVDDAEMLAPEVVEAEVSPTPVGEDASADDQEASDAPDATLIVAPEPVTAVGGDGGDSVFLSELVRAMQEAAASERGRVDAEIEQRRSARIDEIRARQTAEADRMRELAAEELEAIDTWAEGERERIRLERERRAAALDLDLATSLAAHTGQIDDEIERVEAAIAAYRADVDAFFADLDRETDVVGIAQRATRRPAFPDLDAVAVTVTEARAADEAPPPIGVMDPTAPTVPAESWTAEQQAVAVSEPAEPVTEPAEAALLDDEAPQPVAAGVSDSGRKSLLQSVQVVHPTSWLHRNRNGDDGPTTRD